MFVGVPGQDSREAMADFVEEYHLEFPQAVTEDGSLWTQFGVGFHPAWVFIDDSGESKVVLGELMRDEVERELDRLVAN